MTQPMPCADALTLADPGSAEDAVRADIWGLLSMLFIDPPADDLLGRLARSAGAVGDGGGPLQSAWCALLAAAAKASADGVRDEFETLFGGTGRPEVYVYGSFYLAGALHERPLAALRRDLRQLGIDRRVDVGESEDHFALLAESMRYLIAGGDPAVCNPARQRELFQRHIQPWGAAMCDAIAEHRGADFYRAVAAFTREFLQVEQLGFDLLD
ncbi:TorD/DmsD family molecular chaperone [Thiomonas sp.]